jgi:CHAT domain
MDDPAHVRSGTAASGDEVRAIASEIAGAAAIHVGADNRKAYLYGSGSVPPLLHIATHAVADANAMEQSRILFSPPRQGAGGADYLFLKEAYELKLQGVELAVLSACETERGRLLRGEGVQSFSRAFLAAGVRTTVTTLWRVPDAPTAAFMTHFYHHLQRGEPRAEALRLAKARFLESGAPLSDPHYWAAFVLTGEGLLPIPRAVRWTTLVASTAAVMVAMVLVGVKVRRRFARLPGSEDPGLRVWRPRATGLKIPRSEDPGLRRRNARTEGHRQRESGGAPSGCLSTGRRASGRWRRRGRCCVPLSRSDRRC